MPIMVIAAGAKGLAGGIVFYSCCSRSRTKNEDGKKNVVESNSN